MWFMTLRAARNVETHVALKFNVFMTGKQVFMVPNAAFVVIPMSILVHSL